MSKPVKILGLCGSLRRDSYNGALLRTFESQLPDHASFTLGRIDDLPLYNDDIRLEHGFPEPVARLRRQIADANAVVFATPEYNYSIPGPLKNALDWASRAPDQPFAGKPVALMSASTSTLGGARVQYHLRQVLVFLNAHPLNRPEIFLAKADDKISDGQILDAGTVGLIGEMAHKLLDWVDTLS